MPPTPGDSPATPPSPAMSGGTGAAAAPTPSSFRRAPSGGLRTGGAATGANSTLTRKLKKVLDVPIDDSMRASLEAISDVYASFAAREGAAGGAERGVNLQHHSDATDRRNLRSALEHRTLSLHATFLEEFQKVAEQFERVAGDVETLSGSCTKMSDALKKTKTASLTMTDQLAVLQNEMDEAKAKEEQIRSFHSRFHLTPEEKAVLHKEVSLQFFVVLDKVKDIHSHCAELLAQHQQAGVEVMEMTHIQQSQGYEKLNRWVHHQTQAIMTHDVPDIPTLYVRALHALKDRSTLWCSCLRDIAQIRRTTLVRKLFQILTHGGEDVDGAQAGAGTTTFRDAGDPASHLQAISSVLAWVHQSVAEEADLLDNFFAPPGHPGQAEAGRPVERSMSSSGNLRGAAASAVAGGADGQIFEVSRADLLDTVFEGLVRHLRLRVERALESTPVANEQASLVFFFRLESILQFYCTMVTPLLGASAVLPQLLGDLKLTTLKNFFDVLKKVSDHILVSSCQPAADLAPPPLIHDSLQKLRVMMNTLADSLTPPEERESEFGAVLSGIIDPLLKVLERVDSLDASSQCTLMVNSLQLIVTTFSEQPFTRTKSLQVQDRLSREVQKLVALQADALLRRSGISDAVAKIEAEAQVPEGQRQALSSHSATSPEAIADAVQTFYKYMYTLGSVTLPLSQRIQAPALKAQVNQDTMKAICTAYEMVYQAVSEPRNGYEEPRKMLQHTPENVRTLLDVR